MEPENKAEMTLRSLPSEIILLLFQIEDISLSQLYRLRFLCRDLGPLASTALIERVHRVLVIRKDACVFLTFLEETRRSNRDVVGTDPALAPFSVGRLLKAARVAPDSAVVTVIANRSRDAGCIYKGIGASLADLKLAIHGLGLLDDPTWKIPPFLETCIPTLEERVDLILSMTSLELCYRWHTVFYSIKRMDDASTAKFRETCWSRIVASARREFGDNADEMGNELRDFVVYMEEYFTDGISVINVMDVVLPSPCLSVQERLELFLKLDSRRGNYLGCFLGEQHYPEAEDIIVEPAANNPDPQLVADSKEFFTALIKKDENYVAQCVACCIIFNRWPVHVDYKLPSINCEKWTEGAIAAFCDMLSIQTLPPSDVPTRREWLRSFVEANLLRQQKGVWLKAIDTALEGAPNYHEIDRDEPAALFRTPAIAVLRQAFTPYDLRRQC